MDILNVVQGVVVPLDKVNVDTDQIIPKQFLKSIARTGFGDNLFDAWRYLDEGYVGQNPNQRQLNFNFVLNKTAYNNGTILLTRENFGCGSSREHAVWALKEYGFRCIIAESFADIFFSNCIKNSILPIVLDKKTILELFGMVKDKIGMQLRVILAEQIIILQDATKIAFNISAFCRKRLLEGLDDINLTLQDADLIRAYERRRMLEAPWFFRDMNS